MHGVSGHRILSRVRSHKKLRQTIPADELETPRITSHRRQRSESATMSMFPSSASRSDFRGHWPPIEFDPLKLNPPVPQAPHAPARLHERQPLYCLPARRSSAGAERPQRLRHSDSGFAMAGHGDLDFGLEQERMADRNRQREHDVDMKGWPSPASSVDSDKSWFEDDDDDDEFHDEEAAPPTPRRRPVLGSPDDPTNFIKRGEWKRRGIFFGASTQEVRATDHAALEI